MIINALCDYYDILAQDEDINIPLYGYERQQFSYEIILKENGELFSVSSLMSDKKGKPKSAIMPKSMKSTATAASPVFDNMQYIFGIIDKSCEVTESVGRKAGSKDEFNASKELHLNLFKNTNSKEAKAIVNFFENWNPDDAWQKKDIFANIDEKFKMCKAVFRLVGETKYFHDCDEIKNIWFKKNEEKNIPESKNIAQCAITGEITSMPKTHTEIKGVQGTMKGITPNTATFICYNNNSDLSYNLEQSLNSRIGKTAEFKYTTTLNYLLKLKNNRLIIGDDTVVFWAHSNDNIYTEIAWIGFGGDTNDININEENQIKQTEEQKNKENVVDRRTEEIIKSIIKNGIKGIPNRPDFNPNVNFYVLGLAPNAARISVRYFYQSTFGDFCDKIFRYYEDTQICGKNKYIKPKDLISSTVSANSSDKKVNPLLGGAVMRAILSGGDYPKLLLNQVILRVKAEASVNQNRAAAIKACLVRNKKEVWLSVYLNEESKNEAYVLGRTFAILEKIQKDASGGNLNSTIKDKYFGTACSNPALVFPSLLKLAQHHLAKIEGNYLNMKLQECLALIEGETFPKTQGIEAQGSFILGYYQQNSKLYEKKDKEAQLNGSN